MFLAFSSATLKADVVRWLKIVFFPEMNKTKEKKRKRGEEKVLKEEKGGNRKEQERKIIHIFFRKTANEKKRN